MCLRIDEQDTARRDKTGMHAASQAKQWRRSCQRSIDTRWRPLCPPGLAWLCGAALHWLFLHFVWFFWGARVD